MVEPDGRLAVECNARGTTAGTAAADAAGARPHPERGVACEASAQLGCPTLGAVLVEAVPPSRP